MFKTEIREKSTGVKRIRPLLVAAVTVVAMFGMVGCGSSDEPKKEKAGAEDTKKDAAKEEKKDETFGLNETAVFKDLKITATEMKELKGDDFFKPEEGNVFIAVKFKVENVSDEDQAISSLLLFQAYVDGSKKDLSITGASAAGDAGTIDGTLAPGKNMEGYYVVEASKEWKEIELQVESSWLSGSKAAFVITK